MCTKKFIEEKLIPDYKTHASSNVFSEIGMLTSKKNTIGAEITRRNVPYFFGQSNEN